MSTSDTTRFFDTSGCLNLSRPTNRKSVVSSAKPQRQNINRSVPIRGQVKIDLYNFDHIDFADSQYVLTSPRSLEACARLNIKPTSLLPRTLADIQTDKVPFSTLVDVRDEMEIERLAILQRCREEREKIIREEELVKPTSAKLADPKPSYIAKKATTQRDSMKPKLRPSTASNIIHKRSDSTAVDRSSGANVNPRLPPRPKSCSRPSTAYSQLKPTVLQLPSSDSQSDLRTSSSGSFLDDVRRMDHSLQRLGTSKPKTNERYINGLENVKQIIAQRVNHSTKTNDLENVPPEKGQYDLLLSHYDHELKIQKARENARRTEKEKEAERYELLMHDFVDQTLADERRENELRRKLEKIHHSRQLFEALQAKNHELQMADVQKRRSELLNEIKRKDRRTQHFVKDRQETTKLSRTLAKASQDTREYIREINQNFDEKARKAELASTILVTKPRMAIDRRLLQSSVPT